MESRLSKVQGKVRFGPWEGGGDEMAQFTPVQRAEYGRAMRGLRASYGLTDGLKLSQEEFHDYLARRRAADAQARGWS
jgi:hypothetical protein